MGCANQVTLRYRRRRLNCRRCGIRSERIGFADAKARVTGRLRQQIGLDCQSMPVSHAAVRHGVSWGKARRAEYAFLKEWVSQRCQRRPRYLGADEIQPGKGQPYWTLLSDLVHGEVIGLSRDRTEESLSGLLKEELDNRQRASVQVAARFRCEAADKTCHLFGKLSLHPQRKADKTWFCRLDVPG